MGTGYLVTGNPGAGKSTVANELSQRGYTAIDPDYDPEFSYWENEQGERVLLPEGLTRPDNGWLRAHRWVWSRTCLCDRIAEHDGAVFICGIAVNISELFDVFRRIVLLRIDAGTQEERLAAHDLERPPGRSEDGRQQIREGRALFEAQMLGLGAVAVDASRAPSVVADNVLRASFAGADSPRI